MGGGEGTVFSFIPSSVVVLFVVCLRYKTYSDTAEYYPYPTAFPYGNGMVLHFYQQQESSTAKTVHKVINKGLKAYVYSPHTGVNFHYTLGTALLLYRDRRFATLQRTLFIYLINKYISLSDICLTVHH